MACGTRQLTLIALWCLMALGSTSLAACSEEEQTQGADIQASIGDIEMRGIKLDTPVGGFYEAGSAARLEFAAVNTGREQEELIGVSGPHFTGVVVDGAPSSPPLAVPIPPGETVFSGGDGPVLILTGINQTLSTAKRTPVTFSFRNAGDVTVDVVVSSPLRTTIDRAERARGPLAD
ncbi:hypothetical protein DQ239_07340 [Blastococcus sp. TF02-09]|uniref:hypothetical protein n=1 Tax=Blastococcus sp. TF02-09 TaxID=2250576 RepID=UPI000DEB484C|nr:hypothetical protein [Blastococcus sp. TF02-9]RBY79420.1 hypothetical protein DQ239_07340 [Blastococcus sp. TF02-9]